MDLKKEELDRLWGWVEYYEKQHLKTGKEEYRTKFNEYIDRFNKLARKEKQLERQKWEELKGKQKDYEEAHKFIKDFNKTKSLKKGTIEEAATQFTEKYLRKMSDKIVEEVKKKRVKYE